MFNNKPKERKFYTPIPRYQVGDYGQNGQVEEALNKIIAVVNELAEQLLELEK